eukprot:CAMPEP_0168376992 /NCGR_PEP_ID=MMETSP0228-20121227/10599_1 /TAXON_ID=133427 /ORGANISM="Protoceratium reticulatum, Strain CCCM 535 (=CCMP 1889)" /LENGTH=806 /DNA_ID=CAMNT_0008389981 /DNA_START=106 /DNA_END=2526 /DNA_ORIENTATION=+
MGNQILTKYDVQKEPCYYSTELKWRLHSAHFKEKPDDKLTIFLFEKKVVDRYAKNTKEQILEILRKDASSLQRLRHPHILSVVEALVEERSTLAFATKPVVGTVAQLLDHNRHELTALEMKCGILDVAEALQFLHQDAKTVHLGISPVCVFIDPQGKWLLGSLGYSISGVQWGQLIDCSFAYGGADTGQLAAEPPPRYAAPEMCAMPAKCGLESDMFSLGLLTYELMSHDRQPLLRAAPRGYTSNVLRQSTVPSDLYGVLQKLLSPMPSERPTIAAFINSEFFMDVNVRAIRFLEQLQEKDEAQRLTFLRGLPKLLQDPQSPLCGQRVLRERVLPRLCSALLFPSLYGVVMPILITMLKRERVTDCAHFQARMWPSIKPLFTAKEIPIEVVTLFLKELDLLAGLALPGETQAVLLPFLLRCLELQEPVILNEVLEKVPYLHKKFEYRQVKDQILPRMLQLLLSATAVKVKVQVLMGLSRIFEIFDKTTITDVILPAFDKLTKSDRTPAVCMCLLGCYDAMSKHLGHKTTSERIIPLIAPLLVEDSLSAEQWETQMSVCKKLLQRVEAARRKEYEVRKDAQVEAGHALGGAEVAPEVSPAAKKEAEPQDFESLLFAGTAKAAAMKPQQSVPALMPKAPPPPTPSPAPAAAATRGSGLLTSGANLFDNPTPSAQSPMGNFDPFAASQQRPSATATMSSNGFDAFAGMASPAAAAPATGFGVGVPGMAPAGTMGVGPGMPAAGGMPGMPGNPGMPGMPFAPAGGATGPGFGAPGMVPAPGMPGMPGAGAAPGVPNLRNMSYDPFAEIDK